MKGDTGQSIRKLTASLFAFPIGDYLRSDRFLLFCRAHGLEDAWKEFLESSRERPDLYGEAVAKNAFNLFLHHIFHSRRDEFPALLARMVMDFSRETVQEIPWDNLKKDLVLLGYSDEEIGNRFSALPAGDDLKNSLRERYRDLLVGKLSRGDLEELQDYLGRQYDTEARWDHQNTAGNLN